MKYLNYICIIFQIKMKTRLGKSVLIGHGERPGHDEVSVASPAQGAPFPDFGGLLQSRVRVLVPLPQVTEQAE